jgi:hypothetical protein
VTAADAQPVGREGELEALVDVLEAPERLPRIALLHGEAGIGKTTLWLAARHRGRHRLAFADRLFPAAGTATATGLALATVADGALCLRFDDAYAAKILRLAPVVRARGSFTLLGGTGERRGCSAAGTTR